MKKNILFINHSVRDGGPGRSLFYLLKHFDYEQFNVFALLPSKDNFSEKLEENGLNVKEIINNNFPENLKRQNFALNNNKLGILPLDIFINTISTTKLTGDNKQYILAHPLCFEVVYQCRQGVVKRRYSIV